MGSGSETAQLGDVVVAAFGADAVESFVSAVDAWPAVRVSPARFVEHVAARVEGAEPPQESLYLADLYLTCACLEGVDGAVAALARRHVDDLRRGLGTHAGRDDALQDLLVTLTVSDAKRPARLEKYRGRGPLGRWLQVVARRYSLDAMRREGARADSACVSVELLALYGDPELALANNARNEAFASAVRQAAAMLTPKERNVLRYRYVHRLQVDEIAGIYRVSRSTAARRLARARAALVEHARGAMCEALGLSATQLDVELEALSSVIELSVGRLLRDPAS